MNELRQPYQRGKDNLPILEPFTDPCPPPSESFVRFLSRENEREHLLLQGYDTFKAEALPKRQLILADAKAMMETWFESGVRYADRPIDEIFRVSATALRIKIYANAPRELQSRLETAAGEIIISILYYRLPHPDDWVHMFFRSTEIPKETQRATLGFEIDRDIKPGYGPYLLMPLPYGPVFETEGMAPRERANLIADKWYELQARRLYIYVNDVLAREGWQWGPNPWYGSYTSEYDRRDEEAQRLKAVLTPIQALVFCSRRKGYDYRLIAEALRNRAGIDKNEKALKTQNSRVERLLVEQGIIKKRF